MRPIIALATFTFLLITANAEEDDGFSTEAYIIATKSFEFPSDLVEKFIKSVPEGFHFPNEDDQSKPINELLEQQSKMSSSFGDAKTETIEFKHVTNKDLIVRITRQYNQGTNKGITTVKIIGTKDFTNSVRALLK